jgi:hypothetical protein
MPRRGEETVRLGEITGLGLRNGCFRIAVFKDPAVKQTDLYLLSNPLNPQLWQANSSNASIQLSNDQLLSPIAEGMNQTFFDLLMPFVFWPEEYLKSGKVAGRPAHLYEFSCPAEITRARPDWKTVRLSIDDTYQAPLRAEILSDGNQPVRSSTLRSYKKIGDDWIVKSLDCLDHRTRSNTRLEILAAATNLDLDLASFTPQKFMLPLEIPDSSYEYFKQ